MHSGKVKQKSIGIDLEPKKGKGIAYTILVRKNSD
jgi:hypothetical protein